MKKIPSTSRVLLWGACALMVPVFFVPVWQIQMWAPQYPDWLHLKIWIDNITGDIDIINGLNHYIGMKYIKVEMFPEFQWMPYILGALIGVGVLMAAWGRRAGMWAFFVLLIAAGVAGMVDFYLWGYDYGHNLDPKAAIKVPGMVYQPPLIGTKELLNFVAYSAPDWGGWIIVVAGLLVIGAIILDWKESRIAGH